MEGTPQDYMNVGIIHFMAFPEVMSGEGPILETLDVLCRDDYFGLVEVTQIKDDGVRQQVRELAGTTNTKLGFGAQPILLGGQLDLNASDAPARQQAVDAVKVGIDQAYDIDAGATAVLSGPDPADGDREAAFGRLAESLDELCTYSATKGEKPVLLETFDRAPFGKNCLAGPTDEVIGLVEKVCANHPTFGLMVDLSHLPLLGETPEQALAPVKAYLRHVHIGNCAMRDPEHPAYGDAHPMFGIDGGENDTPELAAFLGVLLDVGYIGKGRASAVSFETKPFGDQTADDVITNAKETMAAAWQML